jgi:hypothetical protein
MILLTQCVPSPEERAWKPNRSLEVCTAAGLQDNLDYLATGIYPAVGDWDTRDDIAKGRAEDKQAITQTDFFARIPVDHPDPRCTPKVRKRTRLRSLMVRETSFRIDDVGYLSGDLSNLI